MNALKELALVNLEVMKTPKILDLMQTSFMRHKSLEVLDIRDNQLPHFQHIVSMLKTNKKIRSLNLRGSTMTVERLEVVWLGMRDNISLVEIHHQTELLALVSINTLILIDIETRLNAQINDVIIPRDNSGIALDLSDTSLTHIESVVKYIRLMKRFKSLKLFNAGLDTKKV